MFNLFSQHKPAFGLHVSGSSLKLLQLEKARKQTRVAAWHEAPLPKGLVAGDLITDKKVFGETLKTAMHRCQYGQLRTPYAVVSLPESKSFVRVIQIPEMSDAEADSAIPVEAESFIPLPIDQVYMDWQKIGSGSGKMSILIIASPRDYVNSYLQILDDAGVKPAALEVESQSCLRALLPAGSRETVLIVDMDAYRSSLIMVEEGNLQFTSTVPIAGNNFTESVSKLLGVSGAKAEDIKQKIGIANTADYPNIKIALLPVLNNLSAEIKSIMRFHTEHSDKQVQRIILSGGSAKLKNLREFLSQEFAEFGAPAVELGSPWQALPGIVRPPLQGADSLGFTTAVGLAIRGLEFKP